MDEEKNCELRLFGVNQIKFGEYPRTLNETTMLGCGLICQATTHFRLNVSQHSL